jgi:hypothetical protein
MGIKHRADWDFCKFLNFSKGSHGGYVCSSEMPYVSYRTVMPNMKMKTIFLFTVILSVGCRVKDYSPTHSTQPYDTLKINKSTLVNANLDSLLLEKYFYEIKKSYVPDADSMPPEVVDSIFHDNRLNIIDGKITYSPDSSFKIFVVETESCGAYCNSEWYSWIHFNLNKSETIINADFDNSDNNFTTIENIYTLPDNKYLIIQRSYGRPASVLTVSCIQTKLISFSEDSMIIHPIKYGKENSFGFCQENLVDLGDKPYIIYDDEKKILVYHYGNNYAYPNGYDVDSIRLGQFKYYNGQFVFEKETVKINDRRNLNDE